MTGKNVEEFINTAREGNIEKIKESIANGVDVNLQNNEGITALRWASENGHLEVVKYLVANEADINICSIDDETSLKMSSLYGHLEVVKYLVKNGANVSPHLVEGKGGSTALMNA